MNASTGSNPAPAIAAEVRARFERGPENEPAGLTQTLHFIALCDVYNEWICPPLATQPVQLTPLPLFDWYVLRALHAAGVICPDWADDAFDDTGALDMVRKVRWKVTARPGWDRILFRQKALAAVRAALGRDQAEVRGLRREIAAWEAVALFARLLEHYRLDPLEVVTASERCLHPAFARLTLGQVWYLTSGVVRGTAADVQAGLPAAKGPWVALSRLEQRLDDAMAGKISPPELKRSVHTPVSTLTRLVFRELLGENEVSVRL